MDVSLLLVVAVVVVAGLVLAGFLLTRRASRREQARYGGPRRSEQMEETAPELRMDDEVYPEELAGGLVKGEEFDEAAEGAGATRGIPAPPPSPAPEKPASQPSRVFRHPRTGEVIESPGGLSKNPPQPKRDVAVDVDGDVGGDVKVAGGDIVEGDVIVVSEAQALKHENQARRFDAAFPEKVAHREVATLWVGVVKPGEPPPFEGVPAETVTKGPEADIPMPVDPKTGELKEVHIDVRIRAPQFEPASDTATLTVTPDGKPDKVRFLLEAQDEGRGVVLVQFYLDKKRLGEVEFKSVVEKAKAGQKFALTLQVASIHFAFGVG